MCAAMDFDKINIAINLCVYHDNKKVMDLLINREGLTPERAYILMCAALTYLKLG